MSESAFGVEHGEIEKSLPKSMRPVPGKGYRGLASSEKHSSQMNRNEKAAFFRERANRSGKTAAKLKAQGSPKWRQHVVLGADDKFKSSVWGAK